MDLGHLSLPLQYILASKDALHLMFNFVISNYCNTECVILSSYQKVENINIMVLFGWLVSNLILERLLIISSAQQIHFNFKDKAIFAFLDRFQKSLYNN